MKSGLIVFLCCLPILGVTGIFLNSTGVDPSQKQMNPTANLVDSEHLSLPYTLSKRIDDASLFTLRKNMDTGFAILIDYSKHSGLKRAYLVNLRLKIPYDSFLVSHGCGSLPWGYDFSKTNALFSNEFESHCSSLGHYEIGKRGYSSWGINVKYALHGLDSSNANAFKRIIVLHGWGDVSDNEVYPSGTPEGWGCPAISNRYMQIVDSTIQARKKPILLWAF